MVSRSKQETVHCGAVARACFSRPSRVVGGTDRTDVRSMPRALQGGCGAAAHDAGAGQTAARTSTVTTRCWRSPAGVGTALSWTRGGLRSWRSAATRPMSAMRRALRQSRRGWGWDLAWWRVPTPLCDLFGLASSGWRALAQRQRARSTSPPGVGAPRAASAEATRLTYNRPLPFGQPSAASTSRLCAVAARGCAPPVAD